MLLGDKRPHVNKVDYKLTLCNTFKSMIVLAVETGQGSIFIVFSEIVNF